MRAWAGSYTPQGRSQWAETSTVGANSRANILGPLWGITSAVHPVLYPVAARLLRVRWSRRWGLAVVKGDSMRPTLSPGDRLLVRYGAAPVVGQLVLARFADGTLAVKRVGHAAATASGADGWYLVSDDPDVGIDSRHRGPVAAEAVVAVVRARWWPRPGLVRR
jgi:hypothetical protein